MSFKGHCRVKHLRAFVALLGASGVDNREHQPELLKDRKYYLSRSISEGNGYYY